MFMGLPLLQERLKRPTSMNRKKSLLNWRNNNIMQMGLFVTFVFGAVGVAVVYPMLTQDKWQETQKVNRKGLEQEEIQPGGMRVWSDPFTPRS